MHMLATGTSHCLPSCRSHTFKIPLVQADAACHQPQYCGNPKPADSTLLWTSGCRQPWDPQAALAFTELQEEGARKMAAENAEWEARPRKKKKKKSKAAASAAPQEAG